MHQRDVVRQADPAAARRDRGPNRTHLAPDAARAHLLQRTIGNAAAGLVLQRAPLSPQETQRREGLLQDVIKVTPDGYAAAYGASDVTALNRQQMLDYLVMAIVDSVQAAQAEAVEEADIAELEPLAGQVDALLTAVLALPNGRPVGNQAAFLTDVVPVVNRILRGKPNRDSRYNVHPRPGHDHNTKNQRLGTKLMSTTWADDPEMWAKSGKKLGNLKLDDDARGTPAGAGQLPVRKLTWNEARGVLPRPMLNLLFDVRYQLESGTLVDERTPDERNRRVKSPTAPGTLRSWHQDDAGKLPGTGIERGTPAQVTGKVEQHGQLLHDHYERASQSGAGSSVQNAAQGPRGLAEYTGTGSNGEHNTKVVLDYQTKRVYLTLTHYQFWALAGSGTSAEFWPLGTQDQAEAEGLMNARLKSAGADKATLMSPWIQIVMPTERERAS
ncbi:hypothetical protein [Actinoplanes sp. NPDC020271]|uniref:hypothetical protein n=1 Tax=Actinoplanes sp. NPDC020271 TaxID=3363896 RepID=UPI0037B7D974